MSLLLLFVAWAQRTRMMALTEGKKMSDNPHNYFNKIPASDRHQSHIYIVCQHTEKLKNSKKNFSPGYWHTDVRY